MLCCRTPHTTEKEITEFELNSQKLLNSYLYSGSHCYPGANPIMERTRVLYRWLGRSLLDMQYRMGANNQQRISDAAARLNAMVAGICYVQNVEALRVCCVQGILLKALKYLENAAGPGKFESESRSFQEAVDICLRSRFEGESNDQIVQNYNTQQNYQQQYQQWNYQNANQQLAINEQPQSEIFEEKRKNK